MDDHVTDWSSCISYYFQRMFNVVIEFGENVVIHIMLQLLVESGVHGEFAIVSLGQRDLLLFLFVIMLP